MKLAGTRDQVIIYSAYDLKYSKRPFVEKNSEIIRKYAEVNGHVYKQIIDGSISPYWIRVKALLDILNTTSDNTLVVYFDADAIPVHSDVSVTEFIASLNAPTFDIFISEDPSLELSPVYPGLYNTGVFIVRNTQRSRDFVNKWMDKYDDKKWKELDGKWSCVDTMVPCIWAGSNYEQGAFIDLTKEHGDGLVKGLKSTTLACNKVDDSCFAIHLMGESDSIRDTTFSQVLQPTQTKKVIFSGLNV